MGTSDKNITIRNKDKIKIKLNNQVLLYDRDNKH